MAELGETVLLTGAHFAAGEAIRDALRDAGYRIRTTDGALLDPAVATSQVDGCGAIVHLEPIAVDGEGNLSGETLDRAARGTHVLMKAALEAGVRYVVQGSALAVMDAYGPQLEVTEQWRPRPRPEPAHLAPYLAELVTREFTRDVALERRIEAVCLRFAPIGAGPDALDASHAAEAVVKALDALLNGRARVRGHTWQVLHIASPSPEARYPSHAAARATGYGTLAAGGVG